MPSGGDVTCDFPKSCAKWLFAIVIVTRMGGDNFGHVVKIGSVQSIEKGPKASPCALNCPVPKRERHLQRSRIDYFEVVSGVNNYYLVRAPVDANNGIQPLIYTPST